MTRGRSPAACAALARRRMHASFIVCALFAAAWPWAAPAQDTRPTLTEQERRLSQAPAEPAQKHAGPPQVFLGPLGGECREAAFSGGIIIPAP